jgi:hypothetical protein
MTKRRPEHLRPVGPEGPGAPAQQLLVSLDLAPCRRPID